MNHDNMYPVCTILYKTENTDGWYYATMSGSEKECKKECNKLKKMNNWYDYKCYASSWYVIKRDIPFQNTIPQADYIHHLTDLIYNPFNNKFYYSDEIMPYPNTKKKITEKFEIIVKSEGDDDEYIWEPDDSDNFESGTDVTVSFGGKKYKIVTIAEDLVKDIPNFIKQLKKTGYANLSIEEYTYTKFLAWEVEDRVRFIVQYYEDSNVETVFDKLISKDIFYTEFEKCFSKLKKYIEKHNKLFNEFKLQERFLQNLKWEFDKSTIEKPIEYVNLNNINTKTKSFILFQKNIKEKSEKHTINFETKETLYCYKSNDYYYWCNKNRIIRRLFNIHKEKDIICFLKSKDFEYKKGMSLTEIYEQLLDKGYQQVIDCKFKNKEFLIYANGQVESHESTKEETEELKQIIKELTENIKDKENLTALNLVHILKDKIECVSFRNEKMKL